MKKRLISLIVTFAMCVSLCVPAFATASRNKEVENQYYTEIQWYNNSDFTIFGYLDGRMVDRVSGSVGGETITIERLNNYKTSNEAGSNKEVINVSDYVTVQEAAQSSSIIKPQATGNYSSYAGSLQYRVLGSEYYYYTLYSYYDIVDVSNCEQTTVKVYEDMTISTFIGLVLAAAGVYFTGPLAGLILGACGIFFSGDIIEDNAEATFSGVQYDYNLKVQDARNNPSRYHTYSGQSFDGMFRRGTAAWTREELFLDYYPQFIREEDSAVASWVFGDFFNELTYDVYSWNSNI